MEKLLFVNACVRGDKSRTLALSKAFLDEYTTLHPGTVVHTVELEKENLRPFNSHMLERRDELEAQKLLDGPEFDYAWQFAGADKIIVAAPYWDLSFPSILKVYVEHISVCHITFEYADNWLKGLCSGQNLLYITTAGGPLAGANHGYDFFRTLCAQLGIPNCKLLSAENLDIDPDEAPAILSRAKEQAREIARNF